MRRFESSGGTSGGFSQLLMESVYSNKLPKPPVPKLLQVLPALERMCQYSHNSLQVAYKSMPVKQARTELAAEREEAERKRQRLDEPTEAWHRQAFGLQLPQLITNDVFTERQRFIVGLEAAEKKMTREPPGFGSAQSLAEKIEATFTAAQATPVHPSNPSLKPKRVLPIVPDAVLWTNKYRQVLFDELAAPPAVDDLLFKTTPNPRTTCFSYFTPTNDTGDTGSLSYKLIQNYIWDNIGSFNRATECGEGEAMVLSFPRPDEPAGEIRFVPVPAFMRLKKQKAQQLNLQLDTRVLRVTHRDPLAEEVQEPDEI